MTPTYCPRCLDVWAIPQARFDDADWVNVPTGTRLHVTCGRELEALRNVPKRAEWAGWAA